MSEDTLGSKLLRLKDRSGLTLNNIAKAGGYSSPSSLQRYFSAEYNPTHLPRAVADRLIEALVGFGEPAILRQDIEEFTETGFYLKRNVAPHISIRRSELAYISCHPSYLLGFEAYEGMKFEFISLNEEEEVRRFNKPSGYGYRHIHATYVSTSSMMPRFQPGEIVFYETDRPPSVGSDILICLQVEDRDVVYALGRLAAQTATYVELHTLNPEEFTKIERRHIEMMHPIVGAADILGEYASTS